MAANFASQKILADVGQVNFGTPGSLYGAETAQTIASATNWTVPAGNWFVTGDGVGAQVEYTPDSSSTWRQFYATGYGGSVTSDGYNWRVHNSATTAIVVHYFPLA